MPKSIEHVHWPDAPDMWMPYAPAIKVKGGTTVYLWGGKHPLGRSHGPDETDTRVRLEYDASCGEGARGIVYWVVRDAPESV